MKETAEDILNRYVGGTSVDTLYWDRVHYIKIAMEEYATLKSKDTAYKAFDAGRNFQVYDDHGGSKPADCEAFMKELFKD
jgi:hypothetical protein